MDQPAAPVVGPGLALEQRHRRAGHPPDPARVHQRPPREGIDVGAAQLRAVYVVVGGPLDLMRGYGFDVADGSVWLHTEQAQLVQVDQDSATVVARYGDAPGGGGVIATEDALWLATGSTNTLYRLPRR